MSTSSASFQPRTPTVWTIVGVAALLDIGLLILDLSTTSLAVPVGTYSVAPLLPVATGRARLTAAISLLSVALATWAALRNNALSSAEGVIRLGVVVLVAVIAVLGARMRARLVQAIGVSDDLTIAERRLLAALDALPDAVTIQRPDGSLSYANRAAADLLGVRSASGVTEQTPEALRAGYTMLHEDGRPLDPRELPGRVALATGAPAELVVRSASRGTREERYMRVKATPVLGADGSAQAAVNIMEDLTTEKHAENAQRFLAEASELLFSSLDADATLARLADLVVPELADWCAVDLVEDGGQARLIAVTHHDAERVTEARALRELYPPAPQDGGVYEVLRTNEPLLLPALDDEMLVGAARDDEHLRRLRALGLGSVLIAPLAIGRKAIGTITLVMAESQRQFDRTDVGLAVELGRRAALAVENARLFSERAELARTLEAGLLPRRLPAVPGFRLGSLYRASGIGSVGGDFYDVVMLPGGMALALIGDVVGKGPAAAALTARARHTIAAVAAHSGDPLVALSRLDEGLRSEPHNEMCSIGAVLLDGEQATVICAGHPLVLRLRDGVVDEVGAPGPLLGVSTPQPAVWEPVTVTLQPGDMLLLYTDGVTDLVGADGERFGDDRLIALISGDQGEPPALVQRLSLALESFRVGPQRDDIAALAIRFVG